MEEENQPTQEDLNELSLRFGHANFRPQQWDIIRSIIVDKQDNCVVMPPGYGKSLIYQYTAVRLGGLTIVISPLISLMQDQVDYLTSRNIKSCFLGSAQPIDLIPDIENGEYRMVYVTPEYLMGKKGKSLLESVSDMLSLIAIDEAHYLSTWGFHFRPNYRELEGIRSNELMPKNVPILAVASAATSRDRENIVTKLGLQNKKIWYSELDRPNLNLSVKKKGGYWEILPLLSQKGESTIIYCLTKVESKNLAEYLILNEFECEVYHSGVGLVDRNRIQREFMANGVKIIVSTVAFGMGINKPNIRLVIHYGAPMEFETYYLGVGQAGRDGKPSKCVMFWNNDDFNTHKYIREPFSNSKESKQITQDHESQMRKYLDTEDCRRNFILEYFKDKDSLCCDKKYNDPLCCDNCEFKPTSFLEASGSQTTPMQKCRVTQNERHITSKEDIQSEDPTPAKQPKRERDVTSLY